MLLSDIDTVGEKEIQGKFPVVPPTQLPQLSVYAEPLGVLLQSTGKFDVVKVFSDDHQELIEFPAEQNALTCHTYAVFASKPFIVSELVYIPYLKFQDELPLSL